jgi:glutathione S-transferase
MELLGSSASPFVRKVCVVAAEVGLDASLVLRQLKTTPVEPDLQLLEDNPLAKIPALRTEENQILYDSRVICEYLDYAGSGLKMFPKPGPDRWRVLRQQGLGDGILDAAVSIRYEQNIRPLEKRWDGWVEGQFGKIRRGLDRAEVEVQSLDNAVNIGAITLGCVAGYLDFRFPDENWREGRPALASWYGIFSMRESMISTAHDMPKN